MNESKPAAMDVNASHRRPAAKGSVLTMTGSCCGGCLSPFCSVLSFSTKELGHLSSITVMCYQMVIISIMLLPFISFQETLMTDNRLSLLVLLSVFFTATPHVLLVASLRYLKAATASLILCLHPVYSILFAAMLISEIPSLKVIIGGALIFGISVYETINVRAENGVRGRGKP